MQSRLQANVYQGLREDLSALSGAGSDEIKGGVGYNLRVTGMDLGMRSEAMRALDLRKPGVRPLLMVCVLLVGIVIPAAAQSGKRLIMRDGSWQQVMKYERQGDRTTYFSSVRRIWEEVPSDLVDWEATELWNAEPMQLRSNAAEEANADEATGNLTVAPGLQLPARGGVFLLDEYSEHASVVELIQVPGSIKRGRGGILHSGISANASLQQLLELRGLHARTQAHIFLPILFIKLKVSSSSQGMNASDRFRIVRLEGSKNVRTVASFEVAVSGNQTQSLVYVPTHVENVGAEKEWLKLVPAQNLEPGEYALVEMLGEGEFNSYIWDFGVNPNAPGNLNSRTAYSVPVDENNDYSPELAPRGQ